MRKDAVSADVIRMLRGAHDMGRQRWPNYRTITTGAQYRLLHRLCRRWIRPGAEVLDWGAGNGHASIFLSRAGYRATGYSLDSFSFKDVLDGAPYEFVAADASEPTRLPFVSGSFDAVLSVGVLEHVRETGGDELASLREIRRVLRSDGVMICVHLPNAASWIDGLARFLGRKFHTYRYTPDQVRAMFEAGGFRVERSGRYGALPRHQIAAVLPTWLCDSEGFSYFYDAVDRIGAGLLPWFVHNHYVVARPFVDAASYREYDPAQSSPESHA